MKTIGYKVLALVLFLLLSKNIFCQFTYFNQNSTDFEVGQSLIISDSTFITQITYIDINGSGQYNLKYIKNNLKNGSLISSKIFYDSLTSYYSVANSMIKTLDGNYITAAMIQHDSDTGPIYGYMCKINSNFDTLWTHTYPDWDSVRPTDVIKAYTNRMYDVKETPQKQLICVGDYYRGNNYDYDAYVMKTDSLGNYLWHKSIGNAADWASIYSIEIGDSGSFYVMGNWFNSGVKVAKFDSLGNQIWMKSYFGSDTIRLEKYGFCKTKDGNLVIANEKLWDGSGDGAFDIHVFKVSKIDGQLIWSKLYKNNVNNYVYGIKELADSNLIIFGSTGYDNQYMSKWFGMIFKINPKGDSIWSRKITRSISQSYEERIYDLQPTNDYGYVATGAYMGISASYAACWQVKMDSLGCTDPNCLDTLIGGVEMMAFKEKYLVVYPNPVQDILTVGINVQAEKIKQLDILDEQGKLVLSEQVNSSSTQLSVHHLPKGLYFVQVTNQNGDVKTEKFLKK